MSVSLAARCGPYAGPMTTPGWRADDRANLDQVARGVRTWIDSALDSPLYVLLASRIADDPQLLALVAAIDHTPPLNLLFGGVKMGLAADDALAAWYPHLAGGDVRTPDDDAYAAFRAHALERWDQLVEVGATRRTQTNEAGRSAAILPWLCEAADAANASVWIELSGGAAAIVGWMLGTSRLTLPMSVEPTVSEACSTPATLRPRSAAWAL